MILTRRYIKRHFGEKLILWVNPRKITYDAGTKVPNIDDLRKKIEKVSTRIPRGDRINKFIQKKLQRINPYLIHPKKYQPVKKIESLGKYQKVEDFIQNRSTIEQSYWYRMLIEELETKGAAFHKKIRLKNKSEIDQFFQNYVIDMIESMESHGYVPEKADDVGTALINESGDLHKAGSGNHRFYVARIVGVESVPMEISGVHRNWFKKTIGNKNNLDKLPEQLRIVEEKYS
jgi:hypothetical protein